MEMINLIIDNKPVTVPNATTVLKAAGTIDIGSPTLSGVIFEVVKDAN